METIASRIIEVCNDCVGGNMSAFAREIGVTPAYISKLKNEPGRTPSDRTIREICRVFKVDEVWLRTGVGEMSRRESREEAVAAVLGAAISGNSTARDRLIRALARLPDDAFPLIEKFILDSAEAIQQDTTKD